MKKVDHDSAFSGISVTKCGDLQSTEHFKVDPLFGIIPTADSLTEIQIVFLGDGPHSYLKR